MGHSHSGVGTREHLVNHRAVYVVRTEWQKINGMGGTGGIDVSVSGMRCLNLNLLCKVRHVWESGSDSAHKRPFVDFQSANNYMSTDA